MSVQKSQKYVLFRLPFTKLLQWRARYRQREHALQSLTPVDVQSYGSAELINFLEIAGKAKPATRLAILHECKKRTTECPELSKSVQLLTRLVRSMALSAPNDAAWSALAVAQLKDAPRTSWTSSSAVALVDILSFHRGIYDVGLYNMILEIVESDIASLSNMDLTDFLVFVSSAGYSEACIARICTAVCERFRGRVVTGQSYHMICRALLKMPEKNVDLLQLVQRLFVAGDGEHPSNHAFAARLVSMHIAEPSTEFLEKLPHRHRECLAITDGRALTDYLDAAAACNPVDAEFMRNEVFPTIQKNYHNYEALSCVLILGALGRSTLVEECIQSVVVPIMKRLGHMTDEELYSIESRYLLDSVTGLRRIATFGVPGTRTLEKRLRASEEDNIVRQYSKHA